MKVLALRADAGGCAFYRIQEPSRAILDQFAGEIEIEVATDLDVEAERDRNSDKLTVHKVNTDADVVVIQRPLLGDLTVAIRQLQKQGVAVVVEVDDDFQSVHTKSMAWAPVQPSISPMSNWRHLAEAARIADWVTVSTPGLAKRYGSHGRVSVLRNNVPESIFSITAKTENAGVPRIGWTGTIQTHPTDLQVMSSAINDVVTSGKASFGVVGDPYGVRSVLHLDAEPTATGWVPLQNYYQTIKNNVDIGIAPLEISTFNTAKSWLKPLEFSALEIPFVASPTDEYVKLGVGLIAKRPRDWIRHLTLLASNQDYQIEQAAANLERVRHLTYENNAPLWVDAWINAYEERRNVQSPFKVL